MRIALINSGLGLLGAAAEIRRLAPTADLVLTMDPDGMPWGPRTPEDIAQRSLACARAAVEYQPDAMVFACNTGSVHALGVLRAEFEPRIPIVGTVPAIKPAAALGEPLAIWATAATTGSPYQRRLIAQFAASVPVAEVACPGLADAINDGDEEATRHVVRDAAARTPRVAKAIVLGCTEYELAADEISAAVPGVRLHGSATAVAMQALRRARQAASAVGDGLALGGTPAGVDAAGASAPSAEDDVPGAGAASAGDDVPGAGAASAHNGHARPRNAPGNLEPSLPDTDPPVGAVYVLMSGRREPMPAAALCYREGRFLVDRRRGIAEGLPSSSGSASSRS
jgi:glutamate racemase